MAPRRLGLCARKTGVSGVLEFSFACGHWSLSSSRPTQCRSRRNAFLNKTTMVFDVPCIWFTPNAHFGEPDCEIFSLVTLRIGVTKHNISWDICAWSVTIFSGDWLRYTPLPSPLSSSPYPHPTTTVTPASTHAPPLRSPRQARGDPPGRGQLGRRQVRPPLVLRGGRRQ